MPAWMTPLLWPVWCRPTSASFSSTATRRSGCLLASSRAAARPTIPAPTIATSHWLGGRSPLIAGATLDAACFGHRPCSTLRRRSAADSGETPRGMAVRVRDLEIALVLAREMKAAAERSVDASLRLDQLQEVFGVEELDRAERARIQTALQMAGLEPFPSLLEAEPSAPIRFGASKAAAATGTAPPAAPAEEPAATEAAPTFPTVAQFARSKLRSRRFGVRRGDHGEDDAPPPTAPPLVEANGHLPDEAEFDEFPEAEPVGEEEPLAEEEP